MLVETAIAVALGEALFSLAVITEKLTRKIVLRKIQKGKKFKLKAFAVKTKDEKLWGRAVGVVSAVAGITFLWFAVFRHIEGVFFYFLVLLFVVLVETAVFLSRYDLKTHLTADSSGVVVKMGSEEIVFGYEEVMSFGTKKVVWKGRCYENCEVELVDGRKIKFSVEGCGNSKNLYEREPFYPVFEDEAILKIFTVAVGEREEVKR